jgi:hypothetical protein
MVSFSSLHRKAKARETMSSEAFFLMKLGMSWPSPTDVSSDILTAKKKKKKKKKIVSV